jgi:hypothetical protein
MILTVALIILYLILLAPYRTNTMGICGVGALEAISYILRHDKKTL